MGFRPTLQRSCNLSGAVPCVLLFALATVALLVGPPALARTPYGSSGHRFYRSSDESMVHGPIQGDNPAYGRVTAAYRDGTSSHSHQIRRACSATSW